ncbi:hypothetical protein EDD36DRAFT_438936 [Exophiala viscosa]|uniref:Extracellular membrane protein CFEM domain-containing protein n=1 Tax=Exophiala viscosa TaxID=2486360 RepID=A0AAN6IDB4_9EURO|nr:hypothetical protein EDD36DRAFT_438936 [Exophiala viscosa]
MRFRPWTSPSAALAAADGALLRARTDSTSTCLPESLLSIVPQCAIDCIQSFAFTYYPGSTCEDNQDLNRLCTQKNTSGLTIGEGSLQCVVSFCAGTDQVDLAVYGICDGIVGSQPETARTITATLLATTSASTSAMETLPATIGTPVSTEQISTIVMATSTPPVATATVNTAFPASTASSQPSGVNSMSASSTNTVSGMSTSTQATAVATNMSDQTKSTPSLSTTQIIAIAVGAGATVIVVFALLMLVYCIRRRRRKRRRSHRRSRVVETTPPLPNYQSPFSRTSPTFEETNPSLAASNANGRFYAAQPPMEEKRRSFWRRSIRPEEIGVAVSPKLGVEDSPVSVSSQQSMSRLLPTLPARALWPTPLDLESTRKRRRYTQRPISEATVLEEDPEWTATGPESILIDNQPFILERPPPARKMKSIPPPLRLPIATPNRARNAPQAVPMPLTPTYDNGNVKLMSPAGTVFTPPSTVANTMQTFADGASPPPLLERKLAPSSTYANKNIMQSMPPARLPLRAINSQDTDTVVRPPYNTAPTASNVAVPVLTRTNSISSEYTEIEEDTTPEEINKQLGLSANPPTPSIFAGSSIYSYAGQRSPIKDLRYPSIPRSAAVSRQAEKPSHMRGSVAIPSHPRLTRNQLVRAEASFVQTDTTSSDGYLSDDTIDWPVPPIPDRDSRRGTLAAAETLKSSMAKLRNNQNSANRQPLPQMLSPSLNETLRSETKKTTKVVVPQRSPSTKARLTPSKSKTGDLYLTVEI